MEATLLPQFRSMLQGSLRDPTRRQRIHNDGRLQQGQCHRDYTPAAFVAQGEVVPFGRLIGVCTTPGGIDAGKPGSLATAGCFAFHNNPDGIAVAAFARVFYDLANHKVASGPGPGIVVAGLSIAASTGGPVHLEINAALPASHQPG